MRYFVADYNGIPLHSQPENGYTKRQAIKRCQRECEECVNLFGGQLQDYTRDFYIMDNNFNICYDLQYEI